MALNRADDRLAMLTSSPASEPADERALIIRAQRGEVDAFEQLYRAQVGRVYAVCLRMSGESIRAKELVQDVFVRAWERLATFRGDSAFSSWLHRLAVNVVLTSLRTDRRRTARVALGEDSGDDSWESGGSSGGVPADDVETRIDLDRAIASLPPGARTVFVLHDVEGFRHDEISRMTGSAEGTLRAQLHRARKLLMERLGR